MEYLHTMIRVTDIKATVAFFELMGFVETRRVDNDKGRYTLVFLAAPGDVERAKKDQAPLVELTYNWDPEVYTGGRNFGHLAYRVDDIYATCAKLKAAGVTINRPPRDGHMAFIRTPDNISIELIQKGGSCRRPSRGRRWRTRECGERADASVDRRVDEVAENHAQEISRCIQAPEP